MKHLIIFAVLAVSCVCGDIQQPLLKSIGRELDGQPLTLKCETDTPGITKYEFKKRGLLVQATSSNSYHIDKAGEGDSYTCTAYKNNETSKQSDSLVLKLRPAKPRLTGSKLGSWPKDLKLTCNTSNAESIDTYKFTRQKIGKLSQEILQSDTYKSILKIDHSKHMSGYYKCVATSKNGKISEESNRVKVYEYGGFLTITYPDDNAATLPQVPVLLVTLLTLVTSLVVKM